MIRSSTPHPFIFVLLSFHLILPLTMFTYHKYKFSFHPRIKNIHIGCAFFLLLLFCGMQTIVLSLCLSLSVSLSLSLSHYIYRSYSPALKIGAFAFRLFPVGTFHRQPPGSFCHLQTEPVTILPTYRSLLMANSQ